MTAVPPKLPVLPRGARLDYLGMGTTPGLRPVPVPDPPPVPVLRCIYCGRVYSGVKPAICQGCGAPLVDMAKSAKEEYQEAYWRNLSLPSAVIRLPASNKRPPPSPSLARQVDMIAGPYKDMGLEVLMSALACCIPIAVILWFVFWR